MFRHAPEIGIGPGIFFALLAFIGGWILGVQISLLFQFGIILGVGILLNTWYFRSLEIGALVYMLIYVGLILGILVGDVSYLWQTGGTEVNTDVFFDLFKAE